MHSTTTRITAEQRTTESIKKFLAHGVTVMMNHSTSVIRLILFVLLIAIISGAIHAVVTNASLPNLSQANWLILGPIPFPQEDKLPCQGFARDYLEDLGGEGKARPRIGQKTTGLSWFSYRAKEGKVNFLEVFPKAVNCVAYAYLEFSSPRKQQVALKLGSDDGIEIWCNGQPVWFNHTHRSLLADADAVRLDLQVGKSRLLFKVDQGTGDWGFTARFRTIAEEERQWAATVAPRLRILPDNLPMPASGRAEFLVVTDPVLAVEEPVTLSLLDLKGNILAGAQGKTGKPIAVTLPPEFTGVFRIEATGAAGRAAIKAEPALALAGDQNRIMRDTAVMARRLAAKLPEAADGEDVRATLLFLADQLEGGLHPSLCSFERNLRAVATVGELSEKLRSGTWRTGTLCGLRQWAYRSRIDRSYQPYSVYLPTGYDPQKKYGLIVALHGYNDNDYNAAKNLAVLRPDDFIIAGPYGRGDIGYRSIGEQDVLDVLDLILRIYSVDPDRVYLTGWSMGGMGTWRIGQFFADRFAAMAPFCGWTGPKYLGNLHDLPTLIVHGAADDTVPCGMDREAAARLKDLNCPVRYDELPGVGHDAWGAWRNAAGGDTLLAYFRGFRRDPWPRRVDLAVSYLRYGRQYWAGIEEKVPIPAPCHLSAEIAEARSIKVQTDLVTAFTLDLRHPLLARDGRITVEINSSLLSVKAGQAAATFASADNGWAQAGLVQ